MKNKEKPVNIAEILKLLPHRYPMLLVDRMLELHERKYVKTIKQVSFNEPFFTGHFVDNPIMPGVLIVEALAQTCFLGVYASDGMQQMLNRGASPLLARIRNARFHAPVIPGDTLVMEAKVTKLREGPSQVVAQCEATATVDNRIVASADLSLMIAFIQDNAQS